MVIEVDGLSSVNFKFTIVLPKLLVDAIVTVIKNIPTVFLKDVSR